MSKHHAQIYRNLASLNESGVDTRRALHTAGKGSPLFRKVMDNMAESVQNGSTIAEAMREHPRHFTKQDIDLVEASENTGTLPDTLRELAEWHEFKRKLVHEQLGQFLYSAMLIHGLAFIPDLFLYVFGKITLGHYLSNASVPLMFFYIPLIATMLILKFSPQQGVIRSAMDTIYYYIPWLGSALKDLGISRFSRVCNTCFRSGMNNVQAMKMACDSTGNFQVSNLFRKCSEAVKIGKPISSGFSAGTPTMFREVWAVAEETGNLEESTDRLAKNYQDSGFFKLKLFLGFVNKAIYICIALRIAFLYVSVMGSILGGGGLL